MQVVVSPGTHALFDVTIVNQISLQRALYMICVTLENLNV